jgi:hypothetical protein
MVIIKSLIWFTPRWNPEIRHYYDEFINTLFEVFDCVVCYHTSVSCRTHVRTALPIHYFGNKLCSTWAILRDLFNMNNNFTTGCAITFMWLVYISVNCHLLCCGMWHPVVLYWEACYLTQMFITEQKTRCFGKPEITVNQLFACKI